MVKIKKEKLIEEIYEWTAKDAEIPLGKQKLLRIMIEMTLDYLYSNEYLEIEKEEKGNGKN